MVVLRLIGGLSLRRARSACRWFPTHCSEVPLLARPSPSAKDRFLALPARSSDGCFRAAKGRFDPFATPQRMAANCAHRTARADEFRSLMGQGGCPSWVSTPWGCLCSLRARSALDGVSLVQGGLVEGAVGRELAAATQSAPSSAPSLGRVGSNLPRVKQSLFQRLVKLRRGKCLVGVPFVKIFVDASPRRLRPSRCSLGG